MKIWRLLLLAVLFLSAPLGADASVSSTASSLAASSKNSIVSFWNNVVDAYADALAPVFAARTETASVASTVGNSDRGQGSASSSPAVSTPTLAVAPSPTLSTPSSSTSFLTSLQQKITLLAGRISKLENGAVTSQSLTLSNYVTKADLRLAMRSTKTTNIYNTISYGGGSSYSVPSTNLASTQSVADQTSALSSALSARIDTLALVQASTTSSQWSTLGSTLSYTGGNVGIGTNDPQSALDVNGSIGAVGAISITGTSTASAELYLSDDVNGYGGIDINSYSNGSSPQSYVNLAGFRGNSTVSSELLQGDTLGSYNFYGEGSSGLILGASIASRAESNFTSTGPANLIFNTSGSEAMRISAAGNVGIGTTSPSSKLVVAGGSISHSISGVLPVIGTYTTSLNANGFGLPAISGKYIYAGQYNGAGIAGLEVIDITNPNAPTKVGMSPVSPAYETYAVAGNYVFSVCTLSCMKIFDVSNPASPTIVSTVTPGGTVRGGTVSGKYSYLANTTSGLRIYDVTNVTAPVLMGTYDTAGSVYGVAVVGKYAYVADYDGGLDVIDVSNPALPTLVGNLAGSKYRFIQVVGRYAYVASEANGMQIIDISNPASPVLVSTWVGSGSINFQGLVVAGKYAYIPNGAAATSFVVDISTPSSPVLAATIPLVGRSAVLQGTYLYIINAGTINVIDVSGLNVGAANIGMLDVGALAITGNTNSAGGASFNGGLDVGSAGILSRGALSIYASSTATSSAIAALFMGGNIGIGTTTPAAKLAVLSDASSPISFLIASTTSTSFAVSNGGQSAFGTTPLSNVRLNIGGTQTSTNNAFGIYTGGLTLVPAGGGTRNAYFLYGGGGTVDTGAGNVIDSVNGMYIEAVSKAGSGTINKTYGLYVKASTIGTNNYGAAFASPVGIGTDTPLNMLTVAGGSSVGYGFANAPAPTNGLIVEGNVGIGTTTPGTKLVVASEASRIWFSPDIAGIGYAGVGFTSAVNSSNYSLLGGDGNTYLNAPSGGSISVRAANNPILEFSSASNYSKLTFVGTEGGQVINNSGDFYIDNASANGNIIFRSGSASEKMRISTNGNVGIGTTNPNSKLSLGNGGDSNNVGNTTQISFGYANSSQYSHFIASRHNAGSVAGNAIDFYTSDGTAAGVFPTNAVLGLSINGGKIGIGTTTPSSLLSIFKDNSSFTGMSEMYNPNATGIPFFIIGKNNTTANSMAWGWDNANQVGGFWVNGGSLATGLTIKSGGNVGIGTTTPSAQLTTTGTVRFANFGAGSLQTDANGNVTVSSDERLKDIQGNFSTGLTAIEQLTPISYKWKASTGYDTQSTYTGFSAQNVKLAIPEAISTDKNGYFTLSDRPILATVVNAIKEIASLSGEFKNKFIAWFADASNGIGDFFANRTHQKTLCIGEQGDETCITKTQLDALLQNSGQAGTVPPPVTYVQMSGTTTETVIGGGTVTGTSTTSDPSADALATSTPAVVPSETNSSSSSTSPLDSSPETAQEQTQVQDQSQAQSQETAPVDPDPELVPPASISESGL